MSDMESRVRERAYELWEAAGRPNDRGDEFWHQALVELGQGAESAGAASSGELSVDTGMPFEASEQDVAEAQSHGAAPAPTAAPEGAAAEATVPHGAAAAATEAARNASTVAETAGAQEASARRSRGGGRSAGR